MTGLTPENDVPLGTGEIDIPGIIKQANKIGIKHFFEDESRMCGTSPSKYYLSEEPDLVNPIQSLNRSLNERSIHLRSDLLQLKFKTLIRNFLCNFAFNKNKPYQ